MGRIFFINFAQNTVPHVFHFFLLLNLCYGIVFFVLSNLYKSKTKQNSYILTAKKLNLTFELTPFSSRFWILLL
jgi:hypothetical protein